MLETEARDSAADTVLDGEVARVDPVTGAVDFESIMERFLLKQEQKILEAAASCRFTISWSLVDRKPFIQVGGYCIFGVKRRSKVFRSFLPPLAEFGHLMISSDVHGVMPLVR